MTILDREQRAAVVSDVLALTLLLLSPFVVPPALAQALDGPTGSSVVTLAGQTPQTPPTSPPLPAARPRVSAQELLGGRPALNSLDALSSVLARGHEVILTDETGHSMRGRISSVSSSGVVLAVVKPREERSFAETAVRTIRIVDSKVDGAMKGLAVSGGLVAMLAIADSRLPPSNLKGVRTAAALLGSPIIIGVAALVDGRANAVIYRRPSLATTVSIGPWLGPRAVGASVGLRF